MSGGASVADLAPRSAQGRPRLGLALGGGSARGWAHIGVIRELERHGVEVDVYAGSSIGAVVGACAAAGKLDALETFAIGLNRRRVFALMDISFAGSALIGGARLKRQLARELRGARIEALPRTFGAVATEYGSGREICLTRGDVIEALRASYALPGIFAPRRIGDSWLFDGALSNPVPVSLCRALGADIVVAVNLTSDFGEVAADMAPTHVDAVRAPIAQVLPAGAAKAKAKRSRARFRPASFARRRLFARRPGGAPGIASIMVDAFSVAQERISRSRLEIEPPDVLVNARLSSVGLFDFHRAAELIAHGRHVARQALPTIEAALATPRETEIAET